MTIVVLGPGCEAFGERPVYPRLDGDGVIRAPAVTFPDRVSASATVVGYGIYTDAGAPWAWARVVPPVPVRKGGALTIDGIVIQVDFPMPLELGAHLARRIEWRSR